LITVCNRDESLKYNLYGKYWEKDSSYCFDYYQDVEIVDKYIIVSYLGEVGFENDESGEQKGKLAKKILVFDLDGNYLNTYDTKHEIRSFKIDKLKRRILFYFTDREIPLAYVTLADVGIV
jgi:hypothetical protein